MVSKFGVILMGNMTGPLAVLGGAGAIGGEGRRKSFVSWVRQGGEVGEVEIDDGMGGMSAFLLLTVMLVLFFAMVGVG